MNKYKTAEAFRRALEDRIKAIASKEGADLQRLRRQIAFDRMLARLFASEKNQWVLKGGYAMEVRLTYARATRDIDLTLRNSRIARLNSKKQNQSLHEMLQADSSLDTDDYFVFIIADSMMDLDAAPYGGARFPVESRLDDRTFVKFHLDVGLGDFPMDPLDNLQGRDWLAFAGIPASPLIAIPKEQQFAEKLHAYTRPRGERQNSRTRDLIDLVLLVESKTLNKKLLLEAIKKTFSTRNSHPIPDDLLAPPENWEGQYKKMAKECGIRLDIDEAFFLIRNFFFEVK